MELLIGCGRNRDKKLSANGITEWVGLVTLDMNPAHKPDVVWDLECPAPLPFEDNTFDAIHAYDVLEHTGQQGDWRFFFRQWMDFYRILKPSGIFFGICPSIHSPWLWGDPGHTRVIGAECLTFLVQPAYAQIGNSPMTDYRHVYSGDFELLLCQDNCDKLQFALRAIKPSRIEQYV